MVRDGDRAVRADGGRALGGTVCHQQIAQRRKHSGRRRAVPDHDVGHGCRFVVVDSLVPGLEPAPTDRRPRGFVRRMARVDRVGVVDRCERLAGAGAQQDGRRRGDGTDEVDGCVGAGRDRGVRPGGDAIAGGAGGADLRGVDVSRPDPGRPESAHQLRLVERDPSGLVRRKPRRPAAPPVLFHHGPAGRLAGQTHRRPGPGDRVACAQ